jgi:hypothetical protein
VIQRQKVSEQAGLFSLPHQRRSTLRSQFFLSVPTLKSLDVTAPVQIFDKLLEACFWSSDNLAFAGAFEDFHREKCFCLLVGKSQLSKKLLRNKLFSFIVFSQNPFIYFLNFMNIEKGKKSDREKQTKTSLQQKKSIKTFLASSKDQINSFTICKHYCIIIPSMKDSAKIFLENWVFIPQSQKRQNIYLIP